MARGLSSSIKTALAASSVSLALLAKLELNSTYYQATGQKAISYGGQSYLATGLYMGLDAIEENSTITTGSTAMRITGASTGIMNDLIGNGYTGKAVTVYLALLDTDSEVIDSPIEIFYGVISQMRISENVEESFVTLTVANHWANHMRENGRQVSDASQQSIFSNDRCFNLSGQVTKRLQWGLGWVS